MGARLEGQLIHLPGWELKSPDNDNRKKNKVAEQAFFSSNMDKNTEFEVAPSQEEQ